ncbi:MAG: serine/threonine protein kinase [Siculibacillus sp.]|nr:serine/threonine protein kinase [Siculibacillus sp.]
MVTADESTLPGVLAPGTRLDGIWEIGERIAAGGMGEVHAGINVHTGDRVAIKVVRADFVETDMALAMFRKEAAALNALFDEAIVRYYLFSLDAILGRPYLVMEFVEGRSLKEIVAEKPLDFDAIRLLVRRVGGGLRVAHEHGVFHRDISPDNILLVGDDPRRAKIIDFGIARHVGAGLDTVVGGGFAGKYGYVSPEQIGLFGGEIGARSDIYSFGLVLAEAATGRPRDMRGSALQVIEKRKRVPDLSDVDPRLAPLLARMLQPDPADRPESMVRIIDALWAESVAATVVRRPSFADPPAAVAADPPPPEPTEVAAPRPAAAPSPRPAPAPPPRSDPTPTPTRSNRALADLAAAAAILLIGGGSMWWWTTRTSGDAAATRPASIATAPTTVAAAPAPPSRPPSPEIAPSPPPPVTRPAAPAAPPTDDRSGEVRGDDAIAALRIAEPTAADVAGWLAGYPRADCTLLEPVNVEVGAARATAYGASVRPFEVLDGDFRRTFGFSIDIDLHLVMPAQCPLLARLAATGEPRPRLETGAARLGEGGGLTGSASAGAGRAIAVFLVEDDGMVRRLASGIDRIEFTGRVGRRTPGGDKPQLVVALAGTAAAADDGAALPLSALLDRLDRGTTAALRYLVVGR